MKIESNLGTTLLSIRNSFVNELPIVTEKALRMAANDGLVLIQDRVQQRGESLSGRMQTKSNKRFGSYSKQWGGFRNKKGYQTSFIDWTVDGDLWRSWQVLYSDSKIAEIGFMDDKQADIARYLEDYFGKTIGFTKEEEEIVVQTFNSEIEVNFVKKIS